ncbi:MAG: FtsX-like permease family protein [Spirochaetaceae bacterium]|nr:FtsX-like permease family protein [Spirochaetaceae bacterium]
MASLSSNAVTAAPASPAMSSPGRGDAKFLLRLAWRNLSRHRRRTVITTIALAFSVAVLIFMDSMLGGIDQESQRNLVWYETGSGKVVTSAQLEDLDRVALKHELADYVPITNALTERGIANTPRISFVGELFFGEGSLPIRFVGIDPDTDEEVFRLRDALLPGSSYVEAGMPGLILGSWTTDDLGLSVGDFVEVRTRTRHGAMQVLELELVGILLSANPTINRGVGYLPLDIAQYDLEMDGVTEIALGALPSVLGRPIAVPGGAFLSREIERLNAQLGARFADVAVVGWPQIARDYLALMESKSSSNAMLLFLIFLIAAVGISNTMLIAVYERIREFGMMRALGMDDAAVRATMVFEAGIIGLLGSLAGLVLGAAATFWLVNWGIDVSGLYGDVSIGYRVTGEFRGAWNPGTMATAVVFGVLASMAIALVPARRALRLDVVQSLRHE